MPQLSEVEARSYVLGPESVSWRKSSDIRAGFGSAYALLLQVSHPTISSGVRDHSNYKAEPWQRLFRTLDYVNLSVYGGEDVIEVTQRLREMHKRIKGTNPDGSRYNALEPRAYAWVQATLVKAIIEVNRRFVGTMSEAEFAQLYQEWRGIARLLGVREGDLPDSFAEFDAYFDRMADEELRYTEGVADVLYSIRRPALPPFVPRWLGPVWRALFFPLTYVLMLSTTGLLPPELRERFGLTWTPWRDRQFRIIAAISRSLTPVLPKALKVTGPNYLKSRRKYLARDEFAPEHLRDGGRLASLG